MSDISNYDFLTFELKWQKIWRESKSFDVTNLKDKPKYYILEMFPYPSGRIHMGHIRNYAIGDVVARFKKSKGYNVLHPMGWDAFGLPAENAAFENKTQPGSWTKENIKTMKQELNRMGFSFTWDRELITSDPNYYKHEQLIFIKFFQAGLAYRKESFVNWDPVEQTVLANEQVIDSKGWRSGALVEKKKLKQWFLKITSFADELLKGLKQLDEWPSQVITMQHNWIGKTEGCEISCELIWDQHFEGIKEPTTINTFLKRPHTVFGATCIVISANHPLALLVSQYDQSINDFLKKCNLALNLNTDDQVSVYLGIQAKHPFLKKQLPIFIKAGCDLEAKFGVPAHDLEDFTFAKQHSLPIINIINANEFNLKNQCYAEYKEDQGNLINSDFLNSLTPELANTKLLDIIKERGIGNASIVYRLNDWGVSRQRYWGTPIPMIYCDKCGVVPEKEENLPVKLPENINFTQQQGNPLEQHPTWKYIKCPYCGESALRETDTFDTFFESSWYFLKYATISKDKAFTDDDINYWLPVDRYIGGIEHAILHLLYARFFTKALRKIGCISNLSEPFKALTSQGMICHKVYKTEEGKNVYPHDVTKDENNNLFHNIEKSKVTVYPSEKMSKSKKNTVNPIYICDLYGADTVRIFVLADSPPTKDLEWTSAGISGSWKFINKVFNHSQKLSKYISQDKACEVFDYSKFSEKELKLYKETHKTIASVTNNIEKISLNKAIANIRQLFNVIIESNNTAIRTDLQLYSFKILIRLLNPFAPHLTEEIWCNFTSDDKMQMLVDLNWPKEDKSVIGDNHVKIAIQISGKTRDFIEVNQGINKGDLMERVIILPKINNYLEAKSIKKVIYVQNKIINILL